MLRKNIQSRTTAAGRRFAVIASNYNARYVNSMLRAAKKTLSAAKAQVEIIRVPGAYEIPVVAAQLASGEDAYSAIICLGVVIRGETAHAQLIGESVTRALTQIQVDHLIPVIHEVLLLENQAQAKVRCLNQEHNRGAEAAQTALEMAALMARLR
jgi:6,7-dimethyl-8-ribityllumazine synthase